LPTAGDDVGLVDEDKSLWDDVVDIMMDDVNIVERGSCMSVVVGVLTSMLTAMRP
jgi:hypothetical protein